MGPLSSHEDVNESFKEILNAADARIKLNGLENCSFSYDVPDEGLAKISGYVHVNKASRLYGSAVRTWILDDRISGEIEWTPVLPGKMGTGGNIHPSRQHWRQHPLMQHHERLAAVFTSDAPATAPAPPPAEGEAGSPARGSGGFTCEGVAGA